MPHDAVWGTALAAPPLANEDRLLEAQIAQPVARARFGPIMEHLCQGDVLASPDVPLPASGRVATLEQP
eukprot:186744-Pyramimonas_sp.AAC.1